jgi:hypothetical protein
MIDVGFARWLQQPRLTGVQAVLCAVVAMAAAVLVRAAVNNMIHGCELTSYLPAVLACAILLRWWQAGVVALCAVALHGLLFIGPPAHFLYTACYQSSAGIFVLSSAAIIGVAVLIRNTIAVLLRRGADNPSGGVVFSLENGEVWASWYGSGAPVRLGERHRVASMMADFLAQVELGRRLERRP